MLNAKMNIAVSIKIGNSKKQETKPYWYNNECKATIIPISINLINIGKSQT